MPKVTARGAETQPGRSNSRAHLSISITSHLAVTEGERGDLFRDALELGAPPRKAPVQLMCTRQLSAPHRGPLSVPWGCGVGPPSAAKACCGDASLSGQSTHRLGVWSEATRLASCHLFPGLLKTGPVQSSSLADAIFLETTGTWREVGLWVSQHRNWKHLLTGSWEQTPHTAHFVVCLLLCFV